ncbi:TIGR04086 family membrane protein [Brevibacillus sp. SYP-B805]|uniref:TIGR04086 family membrane protein n=1 Tax=Brevibacillus sp. SYP-B805 TaxID=1578199 RepID=UPI0013EA54F6|nr:TIGR04086 family membrane protein [Brevibacillus sp. SYP-B805]NGQ94265.1 TIGR04086 family membrane protein [Brevibacillus sp. SYP-B805]
MRSTSASVMTGLVYTFCLVLIGSLITALLLAFTSLRESTLPYFTYTINVISLLVGGFITGRRCGAKGWYYGGLTGGAYFLLVLLVGFLGFDVSMKLTTLFYLIGAFVIAAAGGVIGVNSAARR